MRTLFVAIIIALWLLLGWCYRTDAKDCCGDSAATNSVSEVTEKATVVDAVKRVTGPLLFNWSNGTTITDDTWPNKKKSILDGLKDDQKLEITGLYRSDETNNTTFENLGVARANETRKLFSELPDDRFILLGKQVDDDVDRSGPFASANFASRTVNKSIKETADGTMIYFPTNSTNKLNDDTVEKYLDDVAERVKASGETVTLMGHTDILGSQQSNITLGQKRADIIKRYLVNKGVPANKVIAKSAGETAPIATNKTSAGRAKNRRTVLTIN